VKLNKILLKKDDGGLVVLFEEGFGLKVIHFSRDDIFTHFEYMECLANADNIQVRLRGIYCQAPSDRMALI